MELVTQVGRQAFSRSLGGQFWWALLSGQVFDSGRTSQDRQAGGQVTHSNCSWEEEAHVGLTCFSLPVTPFYLCGHCSFYFDVFGSV